MLFTRANKVRTEFRLLNVTVVLKNQNLISSPVRLSCSIELIRMNMYKRVFLSFKRLAAESVTCSIAGGGVFRLHQGRITYHYYLVLAGAHHTELISILKAKLP